MNKVIKKETFEKRLSLEERIDHLTQDPEFLRPAFSPGKVLSKSEHLLQEEASPILIEAKRRATALQEEAKRLLAEAGERVREEERAGYEAGYQDGLAEVTERLTRLCEREDQSLRDIEPQVLRLVYDACEKILAQELMQTKDAIVPIVRQALRELAGSHMVVRLNPEDIGIVKERETELLQAIAPSATILFKADSAVKPGGCVIESEIGAIDAQLSTQLGAMKRALGLE